MDRIKFSCTLCGECCSGSMKVFVNSHDIYKMGRFLGLKHSRELFQNKRLILDKGQNGLNLPRILFKEEPFSFCPFLINDFDESEGLRGFCSLHLIHKPLVCRLAPLYREIDLLEKTDDFHFILPHPGCPGKEQEGFIDPENERKELERELDFEIRYYRLLSSHEEDPSFLWDFSLEDKDDFDEILTQWEKEK
ncbi:MAG: YkgJ family cysteine cluster protein [Spirochaetales bacterium]|nr:YkgJ family cysteine cluster protein [Spirochaetales bacterium]